MTRSNAHHRLLILASTAGLALSGCGAETGNGIAGVKMRLTASGGSQAASTTLRTTDAQGTAFNITRAKAHVRHIELEAPGAKLCNDEDYEGAPLDVHCDSAKIRIEGPMIVDLIDGSSIPSLETIKIPAATYKRVDVRIDDAKTDEGLVQTGDRLDGQSFDASGTFNYQNAETDFAMRLNFNEDARFENSEGVTVSENGAREVLLLLDVSAWFNRLPITDCIKDGDLAITEGKLEIEDKGGCSDVENQLKDAMKKSTKLEKP
jgi:hypothetical protein